MRVELVHAELELRLRAGQPALADTYLDRFPELSSDPDALASLRETEWLIRREREAAPDDWPAGVPLPRLGRFELIAEVGRGAGGTVFRAIDTSLGRTVAVKLAHAGAGPHEAERSRREARNLARLQHTGIVAVHESGVHDGRAYLVSEFIEGTTLADRLRAGPLTPAEAAALLAEVAEALDHAAPSWGRSPRPETVEHLARRARASPPGRLRTRPRRPRRGDAHPGRPDPRYSRLHEPRTGERRGPCRRGAIGPL